MRRVGIDLALKAPHRAVIYDGAMPAGRPFRVERNRAGIDELVRRATAGRDDPCEFIMEPTGLAWLPLAAELARRGHRTYVPKPQKTAALRKFLQQFAKTDNADAKAQALVRHVDPSGVHELRVPTAEETTLRLCVKQRARYVVEAAKAKGRIQSWLVLANPKLAEAFGGELFSETGTVFLRRYVDPFAVRAKGKGELQRLWRLHARGASAAEQVERVFAACLEACALYESLRAEGKLPFDYGVLQDLVRRELERIELLEEQVAALDDVIMKTYRRVDPERVLEREVPGFGPTIAAAMEAYGGDVGRFGSAKRFAAFFGYVPRARQTGDKEGKPRQRLTKGGPTLLKQYLFLAAETARRHDPELAYVYERALGRGKHHYDAVCIVAHKLLRKVYALLKLREQARAARAEGQTAPEVAYRLVRPDTGESVTAEQARRWIGEHCPSKTEKLRRNAKKKMAVEAEPQTSSKAPTGTLAQTGSSEDVTTEDFGAPPPKEVASLAAWGKPVDKPVRNSARLQAKSALDSA